MQIQCFEGLDDDEIKKRAKSFRIKKNFKSYASLIVTSVPYGRKQLTINISKIDIVKHLRREILKYWIPYKKEFSYAVYQRTGDYRYRYYRYWITLGKYKLYSEITFNRHEELLLKEQGLGGYEKETKNNPDLGKLFG